MSCGSWQCLCILPSVCLSLILSCLPLPRTLPWHLGPSWPNQDDLLISKPLTQAHLHRPFSQIRAHCRFWGLGQRIVFGSHCQPPAARLTGGPPVSSVPTPSVCSCPAPPPTQGPILGPSPPRPPCQGRSYLYRFCWKAVWAEHASWGGRAWNATPAPLAKNPMGPNSRNALA